jgi:hypothetical protein
VQVGGGKFGESETVEKDIERWKGGKVERWEGWKGGKVEQWVEKWKGVNV